MNRFLLTTCFLFLAPLAASAQDPAKQGGTEKIATEKAATQEVAVAESVAETDANPYDQEIWDPLEPVNRKIFWFNDQLDYFVIEPLAIGYDFIVPNVAQKSVNHFFTNLRSPIYLMNDLLQGEFGMFGNHFGRMVVNTTLGIGGLFDVATEFGMEHQSQDLGTTLGIWGIPHGPYLVLPVFGPMTLRTGIGRGIDTLVYPPTYFMYTDSAPQRVENSVSYGLLGLELLQTRADLLDLIDEAKDMSVDYYSFVQNTYYQIQRNKVQRDKPEAQVLEDDFEFDESFEEDSPQK